MAKVSAHGQVIGTIEYIASAKRYMSDGVVLRNIGLGWKLHGKVKPHLTAQQAYEAARERFAAKLAQSAPMAAYIKELHSLCGLSKRWKLHTAVTMMPDDADGVWSEVCDGYDAVHADLDEIIVLCRLYKAAVDSLKESE